MNKKEPVYIYILYLESFYKSLIIILAMCVIPGHRIKMSPINMSMEELIAACEGCIRNTQEFCRVSTQVCYLPCIVTSQQNLTIASTTLSVRLNMFS